MRYKYKVGQLVVVKLAGDLYENRIGRIHQQHHGRNVIEFPNGDKADYLDSELKAT